MVIGNIYEIAPVLSEPCEGVQKYKYAIIRIILVKFPFMNK